MVSSARFRRLHCRKARSGGFGKEPAPWSVVITLCVMVRHAERDGYFNVCFSRSGAASKTATNVTALAQQPDQMEKLRMSLGYYAEPIVENRLRCHRSRSAAWALIPGGLARANSSSAALRALLRITQTD
jgi:hypothetical protein